MKFVRSANESVIFMKCLQRMHSKQTIQMYYVYINNIRVGKYV